MVIAEGLWLKTRDGGLPDAGESSGQKVLLLCLLSGQSQEPFCLLNSACCGPVSWLTPVRSSACRFRWKGSRSSLEAIFLGLYLYGWDRIPKLAHWFAGMMVLLGGTFSGIFVVTANAWMNTPTGFSIVDGKVTNVDPIAAMLNPSSFSQALHMTIAAFLAVGFAVAGIHAYFLRRDPDNLFHRRAFAIALSVGAVFALLQPISGDISAKRVAKYQPIKLAAMEAQWETARGAPLRIGGIPDEDAEETRYAT